MAKKWSFRARYGQLNTWSKISFWGSVASMIGLPIGILSLVLTISSGGGTPAIISALTDPVSILLLAAVLVFGLYVVFRSIRLLFFVAGLSSVPSAHQAVLLKAEYAAVQPDSITADERRKADRDWYIFVFSIVLVVASLVGLNLYLRHLVKAEEIE
jgi:hypothetical protein